MLQRRTDLAMEAKTLWEGEQGEKSALSGVVAREGWREGYAVSTVEILDEAGAQALGKPVGKYVTLMLDGLLRREEEAFPRAAKALAEEITALLNLPVGASALVVGLGNRAITPDAIGPKVADSTLVTRHLVKQVPEHFGHFRPVSALSTGVLGTTGVESGEMVAAMVEKIRPACVVAVDALASRSLDRLCATVQLSNTGITPGSGIGNARTPLNQETLGVPVLAIGVPTVVDATTLALDLLEEAGRTDLDPETLRGTKDTLIVTPKDIDAQVSDISKVIGYGINLALQTGLSISDVELFLS